MTVHAPLRMSGDGIPGYFMIKPRIDNMGSVTHGYARITGRKAVWFYDSDRTSHIFKNPGNYNFSTPSDNEFNTSPIVYENYNVGGGSLDQKPRWPYFTDKIGNRLYIDYISARGYYYSGVASDKDVGSVCIAFYQGSLGLNSGDMIKIKNHDFTLELKITFEKFQSGNTEYFGFLVNGDVVSYDYFGVEDNFLNKSFNTSRGKQLHLNYFTIPCYYHFLADGAYPSGHHARKSLFNSIFLSGREFYVSYQTSP